MGREGRKTNTGERHEVSLGKTKNIHQQREEKLMVPSKDPLAPCHHSLPSLPSSHTQLLKGPASYAAFSISDLTHILSEVLIKTTYIVFLKGRQEIFYNVLYRDISFKTKMYIKPFF